MCEDDNLPPGLFSGYLQYSVVQPLDIGEMQSSTLVYVEAVDVFEVADRRQDWVEVRRVECAPERAAEGGERGRDVVTPSVEEDEPTLALVFECAKASVGLCLGA